MADAIQDGLVQHGLLLFRRQSLHDEEILRVAAAFGEVVELAAKKYHAPGFTQVNYVSNLHDDTQRLIGGLTAADQDEGVWHSDQNFRARPATISTLFCVHNPVQGGGTSFTSTVLGYAALPEHLKARIQRLRGRYLPGKVHEQTISLASQLVSVDTSHLGTTDEWARGRCLRRFRRWYSPVQKPLVGIIYTILALPPPEIAVFRGNSCRKILQSCTKDGSIRYYPIENKTIN